MIREDFLLRLIQRLAEVIGRAMGLAKKGQTEEAEQALEEEMRSSLGMPGLMLDRLPPTQAASTLGAEKSMVLAALVDAQGEIAKLRGDAARADERRARADAIRTAAGLPIPAR